MADEDINETIYVVLDRVLAGGPVPPGAKGSVYRVIDALRRHSASRDQSELAEHISLQLQRLENSLRQQDQEANETARAELKQLAAQWINGRVGCHPRPPAKRVALPDRLPRCPIGTVSDLAIHRPPEAAN